MRSLMLILLLSLFQATTTAAQGWVVVPGSPIASYRHDDVSFCSPEYGVLINQNGHAFRTEDGGATWTNILSFQPFYGRSIGMLSPTTCIAGQYGSVPGLSVPADSALIWVSHNSGQSWDPVTSYSGGPVPAGICGISVVNDSVAMGVGRFDGPAVFVKTTDGGYTFSSVDMSGYSSGLIDCHFFTPDSGFAVGRSAGSTPITSVPTVLFTADGGATWQTVYSGTVTSRWCWKISFPSRQTGYVSVENDYALTSLDTNYVLKTTDGGLSWQILPVYVGSTRLQGIGFINDTTGWTGEFVVRKTTDGGATWNVTSELYTFNRMRIINDTTFVGVGKYFSKYNFNSVGISEGAIPEVITGLKGNPNPFNETITLSWHLERALPATLLLYNQAGIQLYKLDLPTLTRGKNSYELNMEKYPAGVYFLQLKTEQGESALTLIKQ